MATPGDTKDAISLYIAGVRADADKRGLTTGPNKAKVDLFIREMENAMRVRAQADPEFIKQVSDLMLYRKDAAKKLTDNILDIGKKAADSEVELVTYMERAKGDASKVASLTNIENQGKVEAQRGGWSGFFSIVGEIFGGIPGCQGIADWCNDRARNLAPRTITANINQIDDVKGKVAINPQSPVGRAMSVFTTAIVTTNSDNIGLSRSEVVAGTKRMDGVRDGLAQEAPPVVTVVPTSFDQSGSVGNIETLAKDLVTKISQGVKMDQAKIDALTKGIVIADKMRGGNNNGKIDGDEGITLHKSQAYLSLSPEQRGLVDRHLGIDAAGKPIPAPAAPAPAPN